MTDIRRNFVFQNIPIYGAYVNLSENYEALLSHQHYPEAIKRHLAAGLATLVLYAGLRQGNVEDITLEIQGNGPVKEMQMGASTYGTCFAELDFVAQDFPLSSSQPSLGELFGEGASAMIGYENAEREATWLNISPLGAKVEDLMKSYLKQEYLNAGFYFAVGKNKLQGLMLYYDLSKPITQGGVDALERNWQEITHIARQFSNRKRLIKGTSSHFLRQLFAGYPVTFFAPHTINFRCRCHYSTMEKIVRETGLEAFQEELKKLGSISLKCKNCGKEYVFEENEVSELLKDNKKPDAPF
ncbi:MAG: hypothetical protein DI620_00995 [Haemophilus parainfluenzae]|jgi:hsp33 protein|nr:MAG: hypothetical protein DI620_00995 [Haemophilus parainfluenzae]